MTSFSPQSNPWKNIPLVGSLIDTIQNYLTTGISSDFLASNANVSAGASGTLAARPAANTMSGKFYYATDQAVLYFSDGTNWNRQGLPAGSTTTLLGTGATTPTGWVAYDGSNLAASTGIYADLATHLGGVATPDTRGRMIVAKGTHADVATVGANDGVAVASRRPKHNHTITRTANVALNDPSHSHTWTSYGVSSSGGGTGAVPSNASSTSFPGSIGTTANGTGITVSQQPAFSVGPQTGAEPNDGSAYIVGLLIAKL